MPNSIVSPGKSRDERNLARMGDRLGESLRSHLEQILAAQEERMLAHLGQVVAAIVAKRDTPPPHYQPVDDEPDEDGA